MVKSLLFTLSLLITLAAQAGVSKAKIMPFNGKSSPATYVSAPKLTQDETPSKAYGINIYSESSSTIDLVSFDVNDPGSITTEYSFGFTSVRGATAFNHTYYIIDSSDGLTSDHLYTFDIDTHELTTVATYGLWSSEKSLLLIDMTYDQTTGNIYALAFNMDGAVVDGDEVDAPLGLFTIDATTGLSTLVGYQETANLQTLACNADGELFALDENGVLWVINKTNGAAEFELGKADDKPTSLQSMSFDTKANVLYWAGFSVTGDAGSGFFSKFDFSQDGVTYTKVGSTQGNAELVGLYIDSNPVSVTAPAAVAGFTVTPAGNGQSTATLSWTNPTTTIKGQPLESSTLSVNIYRNDELVATLTGLTAGEQATWTDENVNGYYTYSIAAVNAAGEQGRVTYADAVFVGTDVPGAPGNVTATRASDSYAITLVWTAPTGGNQDGWFDASTVVYDIVRYPDSTQVATGLTELTFTDNTITAAAGYHYDIYARNAAGRGDAATSPVVVSGPALTVPYSCDFSTSEQVDLWTVVDADADGQTFTLTSNYAGTSDYFMKYFPDNELEPDKATNDWLISAPIHLEAGKEYVLRYSLRIQLADLFPVTYNVTRGAGSTPEQQTEVIASFTKDKNNDSQEFVEHLLNFTVPETGDYSFGFNALNAVMMQFTNVSIEELSTADMEAVSITGDASPIVNNPVDFTVTVKNNGSSAATAYSVALYDQDSNLLAEKAVTDTVASQSTGTTTVTWTPTVEGNYQVYARVNIAGDSNADNNQCGPTEVNVLKAGSWADIFPGTYEDATNPFYLVYPYSSIQTVYTQDQIATQAGDIEGMAFYYKLFNDRPSGTFKATVYLANTDVEGFDEENPSPIALSEFTKVFDGEVELPVGQNKWTILFDEPFKYTGKNLCVFTNQESEGDNYIVRWISSYDYSDPVYHIIRYRGYEPYNFTQSVISYQEQACVSFFFPASASTGDINGDGIVDITDVNTAINMVLGKVDKTTAADLNGDGEVDITDVNLIINQMLGK